MKPKTRSTPTELRRVEVDFDMRSMTVGDLIFEGYASVFNVEIPSYGEIVLPGAFAKSLKEKADRVKVLWQHSWDWPIGLPLDMREDAHGLFVKAQLARTWSVENEYWPLIAGGVVDRMSIGFRITADQWNEDTGLWELVEVDLWEFSPVTFPANDAAEITDAYSVGATQRKALVAMGLSSGEAESAEDAMYAMAVLMGAPSAGGFRDLPDAARRDLYDRVTKSYRRLSLEPPAYTPTPAYGDVGFCHEERTVFAGRYLRKRIADVASAARHYARLGGTIAADADVEVRDALDALAGLGVGDVTSQLDRIRRRRAAEAQLGISIS